MIISGDNKHPILDGEADKGDVLIIRHKRVGGTIHGKGSVQNVSLVNWHFVGKNTEGLKNKIKWFLVEKLLNI